MSDAAQLLEQLKLGDAAARARAAEQLARLKEGARLAVVPLVRSVADADERVREWCVAALESIGPPAADQIADLAALAGAANTNVAYWAITLLGRAGTNAASAIGVLADRLADGGDPVVQQRAAWALGAVGRGNRAARAALQQAAGGNGPVAAHARQALSRLAAA